MKITCQRDQLLNAFQTAAAVAPARSPKSIIQNVKLEVVENQLVVMATDMEIGIRVNVEEVEVRTPGTAIVPTSQFGSMLRESTDEKLDIESDAQGVLVRGQRSEFKLSTGNPDEFPAVTAFTAEAFHEVPARLFRELIRRTLFATDVESSRYALGGVLLEMEGERITAVATDGRRLAQMEGPAQPVGDHRTGDATTIVPTRSMQVMERSLSDSDAEIRIAARENDLLVSSPRTTIYSRLVEGRFPKWRDVFPQRTDSVQVELTVGPFYGALRQAAIVTTEESRGVDFAFGDGSLVLSGSSADVGQSRIELPISYSGRPITVALYHRFVTDFLKVLDPEKTITVDIESAEAATVFKTDDGYGYVVMPLARDARE